MAMKNSAKRQTWWDALTKESDQSKKDAWYARISDEKNGKWYVQIKDGIILEPPKGAAHRKLYSQLRVIRTYCGRYFTTIRPCPSELQTYVVVDMKGETPLPLKRQTKSAPPPLPALTPAEEWAWRQKERRKFTPFSLPPEMTSKDAPEMRHSKGDDQPISLESELALAAVANNDISKSNNPSIALESQYREGAMRQVSLSEYERNPDARQRCIEHYGCRCSVCGFDFEEVYGEIGSGFIHVHHLKPLSDIRQEYVIDPIADLRPICPNCHAMIHNGSEMLSIESLSTLIRRNGGQINSASLERKAGSAEG
jgi:hypothetical protein